VEGENENGLTRVSPGDVVNVTVTAEDGETTRTYEPKTGARFVSPSSAHTNATHASPAHAGPLSRALHCSLTHAQRDRRGAQFRRGCRRTVSHSPGCATTGTPSPSQTTSASFRRAPRLRILLLRRRRLLHRRRRRCPHLPPRRLRRRVLRLLLLLRRRLRRLCRLRRRRCVFLNLWI
jgi:hypothetical protein